MTAVICPAMQLCVYVCTSHIAVNELLAIVHNVSNVIITTTAIDEYVSDLRTAPAQLSLTFSRSRRESGFSPSPSVTPSAGQCHRPCPRSPLMWSCCYDKTRRKRSALGLLPAIYPNQPRLFVLSSVRHDKLLLSACAHVTTLS